MDAALKRLDVSASVIIEQLPPSAGIVLVTDRETCVVTKCGGNLVQSRDQLRAQPRGVSRPTIYTDRGVLSGELFWKRCERCDARHYLSYAVSGYHIPSGQLLPYPGWESAEWTHVTEHEVWQTTLLKRYQPQLAARGAVVRGGMRGGVPRGVRGGSRLRLSGGGGSGVRGGVRDVRVRVSAMLPSLSADRCSAALPHTCMCKQAAPLRDVAVIECGPLFSHPPHTCMCKRDSKFQFTIPGYRLFAPGGREADREASDREASGT
jgi:hypothetical protein